MSEDIVCDGLGNADGDHCCYVEGMPCPFLEIDGPSGRHFACGLMRELGDWNLVHSDPRYLAQVRPAWDRCGVVDCGDWYGPNESGGGEAQCCFARLGTSVTVRSSG